MITISGYEITELIYEGVRSIVYRGHRKLDYMPVVIKVHKADYPSPKEVAKFRREFEIGKRFDFDGVIKYYGMERERNDQALILEDFEAVALAEIIPAQGMDVLTFLRIALQLARGLGEVHRKQIIHKDIKPRNIVTHPDTGITKLIDFGISSQLSRENQAILSPNMLEGTLEYMSPEQTGRMNRSIDYRTDFYSLGVTFYEMLTGVLPFQAADAIELVHCHIAKLPTPLHERTPEIPQAVSDIVMKLLAKTAEDRYQSAYGIAVDLQSALNQWSTSGKIENIIAGQHDVSDKFQIPQKLYGREQEIATLLAAFDRVSQGTKEMMLVSGYSGIGKSALVNEIHKPIVRQRGYFISGKPDQFQRNIPYAALIQAFKGLIRQLLTESDTQIAAWKEKFLAALGPNGRVIVDVIPEIGLIVGEQPAVPELPPTESQNRFNFVFQNFVRVFAQKEHPLTILLDDLQWTDLASLKLIQLLMADQEIEYLFLIGAYRDNEVSDTHPLMLTIDEIQKTGRAASQSDPGAVIHHITLQPLALVSLNQLIVDALNCGLERSSPLASLVHNKTDGNPFFVNQFLTSIYEEKLLAFDSSQGCWQWELAKIQEFGMTDNVVELMAGKLQKLQPKTQEPVKLAACIGNQFDLQLLSIVHKKSLFETSSNLWEAVQEGLILPIGDAYKFLTADVTSDEVKKSPEENERLRSARNGRTEPVVSYKFLHDRVQQAAYSLISENQKKAIHLKIGRLMLEKIGEEEREEKIFDIVNQLNVGGELVTEQAERYELAQLNLIAGKKAKASSAHEPAFKYLTLGIGQLAENSWQSQYDLTLQLYVEGAETAYLSGDFAKMEKWGDVVLQRARTLLDKVKVYEVKIQACIAQNKLLEAVHITLQVLKLLKVKLPENPSKLNIVLGWVGTKLALAGKRIDGLIDLPEMTDAYKLTAMRMLSRGSAPAYFAVPQLFPLIVFKQINLSVKYGNAPLSAFAYAAYGLILCGVLGDINSGYQFGELALSLLERFNAKALKAKTFVVVNGHIRPWKEHIRETLTPWLEAYQSGLETGDLEYAAYAAYQYPAHSFFAGKALASLEREMASYSKTLGQLKQEIALNYNEMYRQVVLNLTGRSENPCRLIGESYNEDKMLPLHLEANDKTAIGYLYAHKMFLCYLFQEPHQAIENADRLKKHLDGLPGLQVVPLFYFYDSLARLAVYASAPRLEQKHFLKQVASNQKKMKKWANFAPMNHRHKFDLVEAERARVLGQETRAMEYYDSAIASAKENEYLQEEALANELAAKFYLSTGKEKIAQTYMMDARYAYLRWGATAKVKDLDEKYAWLLAKVSLDTRTEVDGTPRGTLTDRSLTTQEGSISLDLNTVMKASQTISGEIVLDKLLEKMMRIVIENAGAQRGCLILEKKGKLVVEAEATVEAQRAASVHVLQSIPVEGNPSLSEGVIHYVVRTQENVVLNDAAREGQFTYDSYIAKNHPKSILCLPLIHQGKISAILYLENNLTIGAFTADRLEVLNLLSSQAAISIENARLYENLEQLVDERTQELSQALKDLKATQKHLVESEKMAALGGLVAGVAHEINTPVGIGVTAASLIEQRTQKFVDLYKSGKMKRSDLEKFLETAAQSSQIMLSNLNRAAELVQSFKQVAVDQSSEQRRTFAVKAYLEEILLNLAPALKRTHHTIEIHCAENLLLDSYPGALSQIVTNLVMNSLVHAYDESNHGHIVFDIQRAGPRLIFQYMDDGKGIPRDHLRRIFEPFFTTRRGQGGSGLGLHIVYNQVTQKLNGTIRCESEVGVGTKFIIELPIQNGG